MSSKLFSHINSTHQMKATNQTKILLAVIFGVITVATWLHAQLAVADTTVESSTVKPKSYKPLINPELAAQIAAIEQLPTMDAKDVPRFGTFYSAQCPWWPPLPGNFYQVPVWDLGDGHYLIDDRQIDYQALQAESFSLKSMSASLTLDGGFEANGMEQMQSGVPYLTITRTNASQLLITVFNDVGPANYQLWWTPVLSDPAYPWTAIELGTTGQTNFIVNMAVYPTGFYRAVWDTNSVPLWQAADPNNPGAGILAVFIDSPANGSTIQ